MSPFEFAEPRTVREAISLLDPKDTSIRPFSGGTALMLMMKAGVLRPSRLVSLQKAVSSEIAEANGSLRIGAMARLADIERSPLVKKGWPVIAKTLRTLSNVRVRNVATLGGHLSHGDPHMDLPPLLSALGAKATIAGASGERTIPVEEIYTGYLETSLKRNEVVTSVEIPALGHRRSLYKKCTTRSADDWPALGVAVVLDPVGVVISAATDKPTRLVAVENFLKKKVDEKTIAEAAKAAADEVHIESESHGSAAYKKQLIRVYVKLALHEALNHSL